MAFRPAEGPGTVIGPAVAEKIFRKGLNRSPTAVKLIVKSSDHSYMVWFPMDEYPDDKLPPPIPFAVYLTNQDLKPSDLTPDVAKALLRAIDHGDVDKDDGRPDILGYRLDVYIVPGFSENDCRRHFQDELLARGTSRESVEFVNTLIDGVNKARASPHEYVSLIRLDRGIEPKGKNPGDAPPLLSNYRVTDDITKEFMMFLVDIPDLQSLKLSGQSLKAKCCRFNFFGEQHVKDLEEAYQHDYGERRVRYLEAESEIISETCQLDYLGEEGEEEESVIDCIYEIVNAINPGPEEVDPRAPHRKESVHHWVNAMAHGFNSWPNPDDIFEKPRVVRVPTN